MADPSGVDDVSAAPAGLGHAHPPMFQHARPHHHSGAAPPQGSHGAHGTHRRHRHKRRHKRPEDDNDGAVDEDALNGEMTQSFRQLMLKRSQNFRMADPSMLPAPAPAPEPEEPEEPGLRAAIKRTATLLAKPVLKHAVELVPGVHHLPWPFFLMVIAIDCLTALQPFWRLVFPEASESAGNTKFKSEGALERQLTILMIINSVRIVVWCLVGLIMRRTRFWEEFFVFDNLTARVAVVVCAYAGILLEYQSSDYMPAAVILEALFLLTQTANLRNMLKYYDWDWWTLHIYELVRLAFPICFCAMGVFYIYSVDSSTSRTLFVFWLLASINLYHDCYVRLTVLPHPPTPDSVINFTNRFRPRKKLSRQPTGLGGLGSMGSLGSGGLSSFGSGPLSPEHALLGSSSDLAASSQSSPAAAPSDPPPAVPNLPTRTVPNDTSTPTVAVVTETSDPAAAEGTGPSESADIAYQSADHTAHSRGLSALGMLAQASANPASSPPALTHAFSFSTSVASPSALEPPKEEAPETQYASLRPVELALVFAVELATSSTILSRLANSDAGEQVPTRDVIYLSICSDIVRSCFFLYIVYRLDFRHLFSQIFCLDNLTSRQCVAIVSHVGISLSYLSENKDNNGGLGLVIAAVVSDVLFTFSYLAHLRSMMTRYAWRKGLLRWYKLSRLYPPAMAVVCGCVIAYKDQATKYGFFLLFMLCNFHLWFEFYAKLCAVKPRVVDPEPPTSGRESVFSISFPSNRGSVASVSSLNSALYSPRGSMMPVPPGADGLGSVPEKRSGITLFEWQLAVLLELVVSSQPLTRVIKSVPLAESSSSRVQVDLTALIMAGCDWVPVVYWTYIAARLMHNRQLEFLWRWRRDYFPLDNLTGRVVASDIVGCFLLAVTVSQAWMAVVVAVSLVAVDLVLAGEVRTLSKHYGFGERRLWFWRLTRLYAVALYVAMGVTYTYSQPAGYGKNLFVFYLNISLTLVHDLFVRTANTKLKFDVKERQVSSAELIKLARDTDNAKRLQIHRVTIADAAEAADPSLLIASVAAPQHADSGFSSKSMPIRSHIHDGWTSPRGHSRSGSGSSSPTSPFADLLRSRSASSGLLSGRPQSSPDLGLGASAPSHSRSFSELPGGAQSPSPAAPSPAPGPLKPRLSLTFAHPPRDLGPGASGQHANSMAV